MHVVVDRAVGPGHWVLVPRRAPRTTSGRPVTVYVVVQAAPATERRDGTAADADGAVS